MVCKLFNKHQNKLRICVDHRLNETICGFCWNTKVKPYIDHGGVECPFCYSGNIEGGQVEVDAGTAHQPMRCTDCDAEWNDVYELKTVGEIRLPEEQSQSTPARRPELVKASSC